MERERRHIVAYCRVSSEQQGSDGISLDAQLAKIRAWAQLYEASLLDSDIFVEVKSGKSSINRPKLKAAMERVVAIKGALVVCKLDRFARSTRDALAMADRLRNGQADLVVLDSPIDTTAPHGRFLFTIMAAFNELERESIAQRTRDALEYKRSKGEALGNTPFGWRRGDDGKLASDEREQNVMRIIHRWHAQGWTASQIRQGLEIGGHRPREGWTKRHVRLHREQGLDLGAAATRLMEQLAGSTIAEAAAALRASGLPAPSTSWSRAQIAAVIAYQAKPLQEVA